jgi:ADP-heptose:LPS heptosyltransferase
MVMAKGTSQKIFLVFNTACFGDVLLCNSLCQNIKLEYPDSKIVFICDKPYADVAKYQKDVDEVVVYDKKGVHKGFRGFIRFLLEFPYKKPYASFVAYPNLRNVIISCLIGAKHISELKTIYTENKVQYSISNLLKSITYKDVKNIPIKYIMDSDIPERLKNSMNSDKKYIAFSPISKNPEKDIPLDVAVDVVNKLSEKFCVLYLGAGEKALNFAQQMKNKGANFIDLTNKTSFPDLARVLQNCSAVLSVDTGTMHLSYALGVPTTCVFYRQNTVKYWAPDTNIYDNVSIIDEDYSADRMCSAINNLIKG